LFAPPQYPAGWLDVVKPAGLPARPLEIRELQSRRLEVIYPPMILVLDNYDSFTYNLVQYLGELGVDVQVRRNDEITIDQIRALKPERILVSPGPCSPRESGLSNEVIRTFANEGIPIFGVCLGHQCIGFTAGAIVERNFESEARGGNFNRHRRTPR